MTSGSYPVASASGAPWKPRQDPDPLPLAHFHRITTRIAENVSRVVVGKPDVVRLALVTLLAEGHLLVEDVPGVGKTLLAKALARSVDCTVNRIQFTPDLLPSDLTGVSVYNRASGSFEFRSGPVFANVVIGDEINRASPKTQAALLECMEEHQVTVDDETHELSSPFMVIATQNPIEMDGTYALPEAQRDRFTARISIGYPDPAAELEMIDEHSGTDPLADLEAVSDAAEVAALIATTRRVHLSPEIRRYAVDIAAATRTSPELRLGASPRATLHLVRAGRATAALDGRDYVVPDDLRSIAVEVLSHRLVPASESRGRAGRTGELVSAALDRVPVPRGNHSAVGNGAGAVPLRGLRG